MKNFIKISNDGLICAEDIMLIGSSTKRGDSSKIGQFGSGWKFALAWVLRNDLSIRIFSGQEEVVVDFTVKMHRETPVKILTVNGRETSITSGMGEIDWKGWMAIREIVSNAIDEGNEHVTSMFNPEFVGADARTTIFIEMNGELAQILLEFDNYFSFNRKPLYENAHIKLYKKAEKSKTIIFRKGIRCFEADDSVYDFCLSDVEINESRLSNRSAVINSFERAIATLDQPTVLLDLLQALNLDYFPTDISDNLLACMSTLCTIEKFTPAAADGFAIALPGRVRIPTEWYKKLRDLGLCEDVFEIAFGKASSGDDSDFFVDDADSLDSERLTYMVREYVNFIDKIVIVTFLSKYTSQKIKDGVIYISKATVSRNSNDVSLIASMLAAISQYDFKTLMGRIAA
jgi:hypothetical protein